MMNRARAIYQQHTTFVLFAVLFVSFRVMTLLLYRPGGFFADYSDYNTSYLPFAQWSDRGLYPFVHYWLEWPPLFAWLVVGVYRLSLLLPQWTDPRLWYNTLLGLSFMPFEIGNFVLIYLLGQEIYDRGKALICALIYASLFAPLYVWSGWNDSLPVFFFLLGLYLLLKRKGVAGGAVAGIGFWVKVTPLLLLPIGLRVLEGVRRKVGFLVASLLALAGVGLPFALVNRGFLWAFFANLLGRSSWETIWALWDGYYSYGVVTADRLSVPSDFNTHSSSAPWAAITLVFAVLLLWLYTRKIDYTDKVRSVALAGLTMNLFMLYSKGYSPQFIVQLIPFVVLLLPNLRGVAYIILLDAINFLEATVYFIVLPDQTWLLVTTVLLRTLLLVALSFEYGLILFDVRSPRVTTLHRRASIALLVYTAVSLCALVYPLGQAYVSSRRQAGVYGSASTVVRAQALPDGPDTGVRPSADVRPMPATSGADDGHPLLAGELLSVDLYPWPTGDAHEGEVRWLTYVELHRDHARQAP
ncbi:MAG TPA: glycosyltransferase 87 family protein [Anaerolineae bacterium]|nr:glycosyltransferase 87 family protein [Anaerolineae bacterium]